MPAPLEAPERLILEHATEHWHQLGWLLLTAVMLWIAWRWYGERPAGWRGISLRSLRLGAVLLVMSLVAAPAWLRIDHSIVPGRIAIAVDASASMARSDRDDGSARITAAAALENLLTVDPERVVLSRWRLGDSLQTLPRPAPAWSATQATEASSDLATQVLELADRARPDRIILVSDGRVTRGLDLATVGPRLAGLGIRVLALAVGSDQLDPELQIVDIVGPRDLPRDERQPYTIRWRYRALEGAQPMHLHIENQAGQVLTEGQHPLEHGDAVVLREAALDLDLLLREPGTHDLTVVVAHGDLEDRTPLRVRVHDRQLTVLLLAQRPRWEWRFLRAALQRDRTVEVHSYLHPGTWLRWGDSAFGPEGTLRLDGPSAAAYDAILIGDVPPTALPPAIQTAISDAVRRHATGLLWLPGERGHLAELDDGPLAALLPARIPDRAHVIRGYRDGEPLRARRSQHAREAGLLPPPGDSWLDMPPLHGHLPIAALQPGAQVLLESDQADPLIIVRSYGAGRAALIGFDDSWRWREGRGDRALHLLHSQLIRWLSAGRLFAEQPWRIAVSPFQLHPGRIMHLSVAPAGTIDPNSLLPEAVTLRLSRPEHDESLIRLLRQGDSEIFTGEQPAPAIGSWSLSVVDGLDPETVQDLTITVNTPDEENRDPRLDRPALEALAQATGGAVFDSPQDLIAALDDPSRTLQHSNRLRFWDRPWALALLLVVLCLEWSLRRWWRLP